MLGALSLTAAACGSGSTASTSAHQTGASSGGGTGAVVSTASVSGTTSLVGADGHTLYEAAGESAGHIRCVGSCTTIWKPVLATAAQARTAAAALGPRLTVVARPGGGSQLAYAGHPLYSFTMEGPHQMHGNGVSDQFGGSSFQWSAATTTGPARPHPGKPSTSGGSGSGSGSGSYGY